MINHCKVEMGITASFQDLISVKNAEDKSVQCAMDHFFYNSVF